MQTLAKGASRPSGRTSHNIEILPSKRRKWWTGLNWKQQGHNDKDHDDDDDDDDDDNDDDERRWGESKRSYVMYMGKGIGSKFAEHTTKVSLLVQMSARDANASTLDLACM
ncbi:hypothetical protein PV326_003340 [Microctonus aethiopoides]|nr:hypothetical protein PV326_003340 [Microctonus aethiopoides]